jgi:hypothetical protein
MCIVREARELVSQEVLTSVQFSWAARIALSPIPYHVAGERLRECERDQGDLRCAIEVLLANERFRAPVGFLSPSSFTLFY